MSDIVLTRTAAVIAGEINNIKAQVRNIQLSASVEIGRKLHEAKALVAHGEWEGWLAENVDYSQSTANNLMRIATEFGDEQISLFSGASNSETFAHLTYSQAVALFALPPEERTEFVETHDMESMSTRELKAEIEAVKREKDALTERIAQMEEEAIEAERDYNGKADELENAQKALREANTEKKNAEATAESAKKLAAAYEKEKNKAVKEKAAAEKKEADLLKQINEATAKIKELEESAENKAEPEQMTVEAAVSEEAIAEERARIKEELRAEIKAEYEKKLAAAANPDVQRCTVHFEAFCSDFQRMTKALAGLPEDSREKIKKNVREVLQRMMEEFKDE